MVNCRGITVLGLGNLLLKDDGIGVWLLRELLRQNNLPAEVHLYEVGTAVFAIPALIEEENSLLIVDALQSGDEPGTVYKLTGEGLNQQSAGGKHLIALHDFRLQDILYMTEAQRTSSLHIFGIEPEEIDFGYGLSPSLSNMFPSLIDTLKKEIKRIIIKDRVKAGFPKDPE